jgi:hypothetical protein
MFLGDNTTGTTGMSITTSKKSIIGNATTDVFTITKPPSATKPISQYGEIVISGMNTRSSGGDVIYSQKASFIIHNFGGTIASSSLTTDKDYTSSGSTTSVTLVPTSATVLTIKYQTPDTATTLTQDYIVTLKMYPGTTSTADLNFIIQTV